MHLRTQTWGCVHKHMSPCGIARGSIAPQCLRAHTYICTHTETCARKRTHGRARGFCKGKMLPHGHSCRCSQIQCRSVRTHMCAQAHMHMCAHTCICVHSPSELKVLAPNGKPSNIARYLLTIKAPNHLRG